MSPALFTSSKNQQRRRPRISPVADRPVFVVCEPTLRGVGVYRQFCGYAREFRVRIAVVGSGGSRRRDSRLRRRVDRRAPLHVLRNLPLGDHPGRLPAVSVLSTEHPIAITEQTALLDQLSRGRFRLRVGRGGVVVAFGSRGGYRGSAGDRAAAGGLGIAIASGVGFGLFFVALDASPTDSGLWPLLAAKAAAVVVFGPLILARRSPDEVLWVRGGLIVLSGVADMVANILSCWRLGTARWT